MESSSSDSIDTEDILRRRRSLSSWSLSKWSSTSILDSDVWTNVHPKRARNRKDSKIISSVLRILNLDKRLDDCDIRTIFDVYGAIISVKVYYNLIGESTGTADIVFARRKSAIIALNAINRGMDIPGCKRLKATIIHWYCPKGLAKK